MKQAVITVTGKDRPGIIAKLTSLLYKAGANLEDASMTILEGEFAMILIAGYENSRSEGIIKKGMAELGKSGRLTLSFRKATRRLRPGKKHRPGTRSFLLTAAGKDKTGIVCKISRALAKYKCNITDLNSKILGTGKSPVYVLMLEADIPRGVSRKLIEKELERLAKALDVEIRFKPVQLLDL